MAHIVISEIHHYSVEKDEYLKWLDEYCKTVDPSTLAHGYESEIKVYDDFIDWITTHGHVEIEGDDGTDVSDVVVPDVMERVDPNGLYKKKAEIENEIELAEKRIRDSQKELEKLQAEMRGLGV